MHETRGTDAAGFFYWLGGHGMSKQDIEEPRMTDDGLILVGLGEVLWDLLPAGRELGGAPANFAYHANMLGHHGAVASCVGGDDLGQAINTRLDELGLDRSAVAVDAEHGSGTVTVQLDQAGQPSYTIHENVAWDFIPTSRTLLDLAARADAVCFGSLAQRSPRSRETIVKFLAAARVDCLKVFDINLRQSYFNQAVIASSLLAADVLKLNDQELPIVASMFEVTGTEQEVMDGILKKFALDYVILTRGGAGSVIHGMTGHSVCLGQDVEVADTVGAGDAFTAAVASGLLLGADLGDVHNRASRLAAYVCTQPGATPAVPTEVMRL